MKRRIGVRLLLAAVPTLMMLACSTAPLGPDATVREFYGHLNEGEYAKARRLYTTEAKQRVDEVLAPAGGFEKWGEHETRHGTVAEVRILGSQGEGDGARVEYEIVYGDGATTTRSVSLTQVGGTWKMGLIE